MKISKQYANFTVMSVLLIAGAFVFAYHRTFAWLIECWWQDKEYSHGFLVPFIAAYLVWIKRERLAAIEPRPSYLAGSIVLLISFALIIAGRAGAIIHAEGISLLLIIPGIVLFILGWPYLRALALPLAYLQFMVPWTDIFLRKIQWPFQLFSAKTGTFLLQAVGIAAFRDGNYIYLPNISMEVARECSGVNFLTTVLAIGVPLVYLSQKTWLRAVLVIAIGSLITIFFNGIRVFLAGVMGYYYGAEMLHGPGHIFQGWFVAQVGLICLFIVNWRMSKLPSQSTLALCDRQTFTVDERHKKNSGMGRYYFGITALSISLIVLGVYLQFFAVPRPVPSNNLINIPYSLGNWQGHDSTWFPAEKYFPSLDRSISRTYKDISGKEVFFYLGYLDYQDKEKKLVSFRSEPLFEGGHSISSRQLPETVYHSFPFIEKRQYEIISWYHLPSGNVSGKYKTKLRIVKDSIAYGHNNGAVLLLAVPSEGDNTVPSTQLLELANLIASKF